MYDSLEEKDLERYKRHLMLAQVGEEGQLKIKNSRVLIIGAGGLGCPVALYLTAAGVGTLGIVDFDSVDVSNLQRQIIYTEQDIGKNKALAARQRLQRLNSDVVINAITEKLEPQNIEDIVKEYDIVVDATDNFTTRYLISDTCIKLKKPEIYGAIFEFYGQVTVFGENGPCLRCLNPNPPKAGEMKSTKDIGVLGAIPGIIGSLQGAETLKCILKCGQSLKGRMIFVDALTMKFDEIELPKNPKCTVCGGL
ncbi:MAG: HesA/MoeB/ThiF family protein [Oscillospiraceae bacterium]